MPPSKLHHSPAALDLLHSGTTVCTNCSAQHKYNSNSLQIKNNCENLFSHSSLVEREINIGYKSHINEFYKRVL